MPPQKLHELAQIVRSKNAKPFRITFDIVFSDLATYERVKAARVLTRETISNLYKISTHEIVSLHEFDPGLAIKFTLRRKLRQGDAGDTDIYGCQQHAPLLDVEVP